MKNAYIINSEVRTSLHPDGAVLLDLDSGLYYSLNDTGKFIWAGLQKSRPLEQILEDLVDEFPGHREQIHADLTAFVEYLESKGLCRRV